MHLMSAQHSLKTRTPDHYKKIVAVHDSIQNVARDNNLSTPTLFGGAAILFYVTPARFRVDSNVPTRDIDYIIPAEDSPKWEQACGITFSGGEAPGDMGSAKFIYKGTEVEFYANPAFTFHDHFSQVQFSFNLADFPPRVVTIGDTSAEVAHPALQLAFKLLLGRGIEKGKYDFEDAVALIEAADISGRALKATLLHQKGFTTGHFKTIMARLLECNRIGGSAKVKQLCNEFERALHSELNIGKISPRLRAVKRMVPV